MDSFTFLPYPPTPSLPGNGSVNTFLCQQIHTTMVEMLDALFSLWSVSYKSSLCVCVSTIIARQWLGKQSCGNKELLEALFSM
jgi:hypothetical protein